MSDLPQATYDARRSRRITIGVASVVLGICIVTPVTARTGDSVREGVRNGTSTRETEFIGRLAATNRAKGGYVTRQSNLSSSGGGAIYGCRARAGGTGAVPPSAPCVRASNLANGFAFEFNSNFGDVVGLITAGAGGDGKKPFTTNATGVATGLNADRVDGSNAADIVAASRAKAGLAAESADTATRANTVDTVAPPGKMTFVDVTATDNDPNVARAAASEVVLLQRSPFTFYGKCFADADADEVFAEIFVRTSQDGSILDGQADFLSGDPAFLNAGTLEVDRQIDTEVATADTADVDLDEEFSSVIAPDGTILHVHAQLAVKNGTIGGGDGPYGAGDRCGFAILRVG